MTTARTGLVLSVHGLWLRALDEQHQIRRLKTRRGLPALAAGDRVQWREAGNTGRVQALCERRSLLQRPRAGGAPRPIAANLDQVLVVVASRPTTSEQFIDRYLVNLALQQLPAIIVIHKTDLLDEVSGPHFEGLKSTYEAVGYRVIYASSHTGHGLSEISEAMAYNNSIMVGHSGVGKSSLAKKLVPDADINIGTLADHERHGKHTTSNASLLLLPHGGTLVDSPGVRDFATWHLPSACIAEGFPEIAEQQGHCRFRDCRHIDDAGCAIKIAVDAGQIALERWRNYKTMRLESEAAEQAR